MWFLVALLGGGAVIWWNKTAFPDKPWVAAVVAAGVVLTLMVYYLINDEDAPDEKGDNVYYLGFLFTLISLMVALVEIFVDGTDATQNAENIHNLLKNFGIALTSTVVGITGRVFLLNWQRDASPSSPEFRNTTEPAIPPTRANTRDLERFNRQLLGRIARDLTQGANALDRFHKIVRSHASDTEESLRSHSERLKHEGTEFQSVLQRNVDAFSQEIKEQAESTLQVVGSSLDKVTQQAETLLERLQSTHDSHLVEIRQITHAFHEGLQSASSQNLDALHRNFDAAAKQSRSLAEYLSDLNVRMDKVFGNFESSLENVSESSTALSNKTDQAAKSTASLEAKVDKLCTALAPLHIDTEAITGMLNTIGELDERLRSGRNTEQVAQSLQQIGETLRTIIDETAATTEQAARAVESIETLTRSVQKTEGETRRTAEALRALASEAEARVESLRQQQGSILKFWPRSR